MDRPLINHDFWVLTLYFVFFTRRSLIEVRQIELKKKSVRSWSAIWGFWVFFLLFIGRPGLRGFYGWATRFLRLSDEVSVAERWGLAFFMTWKKFLKPSAYNLTNLLVSLMKFSCSGKVLISLLLLVSWIYKLFETQTVLFTPMHFNKDVKTRRQACFLEKKMV